MARALQEVLIPMRVKKDRLGNFVYEFAIQQATATDPGSTKVWDLGLKTWPVGYTINDKLSVEENLQGIYNQAVTQMNL